MKSISLKSQAAIFFLLGFIPLKGQINIVTTAVPFLRIAPDSRRGWLGPTIFGGGLGSGGWGGGGWSGGGGGGGGFGGFGGGGFGGGGAGGRW